MPFKSEKQRAFMWAQKPELAKKWTKKYGSKIKSKKKSIVEKISKGKKK